MTNETEEPTDGGDSWPSFRPDLDPLGAIARAAFVAARTQEACDMVGLCDYVRLTPEQATRLVNDLDELVERVKAGSNRKGRPPTRRTTDREMRRMIQREGELKRFLTFEDIRELVERRPNVDVEGIAKRMREAYRKERPGLKKDSAGLR